MEKNHLDNSNLIEIEHVQRWKKEFPEYFTKQTVGENEPPKDKVPKFCKGPQNWRDWFNKQEPFVRGMFNWKTNEYDIRYVLVYQSLTDELRRLCLQTLQVRY